ncbi:MAG: ABC transporter permease [Phycisphaerales bacterium]|nr:ABC transporter permease [Phycisphaerales bacterium]
MDNARLTIALIDSDNTPASTALAKRLASAEELRIIDSPSPTAAPDPLAWARQQVLLRKAVAYVHIPTGYAKARENMFAGQTATVQVGADPSRAAERGMLQGILQQHAFASMADDFRDPAAMRKQTAAARKAIADDKSVTMTDRLVFETFFTALDSFMTTTARRDAQPATTTDSASPAPRGPAFMPVRVEFSQVKPDRTTPTNAFAVSFPQGLVWGVMGAAMGFAVSFIGERRSGTFARLASSPMPAWKLIVGKALACFITIAAAMAAMLVLASWLGVSLRNTTTLAVALAVVAFAFVGIMSLLAVLAPTERAASGLGWAVMMVLAFIGGAAVPTFVMPGWMQAVSNVSPMAWAMACLEGGIWRNLTVLDIAPYLAALLALGTVGLVVAIISVRRLAAA